MNRSLVYVALAIVVIMIIAVGLMQIGKDTAGAGPASATNIERLLTGQVANFTLNDNTKPTAEISFRNWAGELRSLTDFTDRVVLVNFWATWCAPCIREMPSLARLEAALGGDDFKVVAISVDRQGIPAVDSFYKKHAIESLQPFVDTKNMAPHALRVIGLPTTVLLDRKGQEIGRLVGGIEWDSPEAVALIRHFIGAP